MLHLSEHEGFCIPLLEAFHFGIPVIARPVGGMPEVAGDAALWTDDPPDLAAVAELLGLAAGDGELRAELAERGRARLEEFAPEPDRGAAARGGRGRGYSTDRSKLKRSSFRDEVSGSRWPRKRSLSFHSRSALFSNSGSVLAASGGGGCFVSVSE